jgi:cbb3-type cytochrome oxidase subunit 3
MNVLNNTAFIGSVMAIFFAFFFGVVLIYTFLIKSRKSCEEAAKLPFLNDSLDTHPKE